MDTPYVLIGPAQELPVTGVLPRVGENVDLVGNALPLTVKSVTHVYNAITHTTSYVVVAE